MRTLEQLQPWLIVGLGNPGSEYQNTRHNVGRATVELMASRAGAKFSAHRSQTMFTRVNLAPPGGRAPAILAYSRSYMNTSGPPVAGLTRAEGIAPERILVIHDDLDLEAHVLRLKMGGGSGGHNGLKSLSSAFKDQDYARLRIGIGRPPGSMDPARYVLAPIPKAQVGEWDVTYALAADAATDVVLRGFVKAQMDLHSRESR
ncbi:aminoacyl-tRNA hydrolase [Actinomycetaceae bacterium MB13-C1-2]|nr:aminoacyl-tRNA hydrolase [Actinomycetaceae bacterium MB13-C1-2]